MCYAPLVSRSLDDILADFDATLELADAWTIPGSWYTDSRVAELERRAVFGGNWQVVGRTLQVAQPGQYVTATVGGEPIVVVRGADGQLRGFYNVCRHQAAAVMTEPAGCAERLRCPYHGWVYGLDGQLKSMPEFEGVCNFDRAQNGLLPIRVDTWEHFVFVCLDEQTPPLARHLGALVEQFKPLGVGALK